MEDRDSVARHLIRQHRRSDVAGPGRGSRPATGVPVGPPDDDRQLLAQILAGELTGLGSTFDRYGFDCLHRARRVLEEGQAEDVVFEVFLELWRQPPQRARNVGRWLRHRTDVRARSHATLGV